MESSDEEEYTKQILLDSANEYFNSIGLQFTIRNKDKHHVTGGDVYRIDSIKCSISLSIAPNEYIYIDNLEKCDNITGSTIIEMIKSFGKHIGVKYIKLFDASGIKTNTCDFIAFAPFTLYTKGKTWYQLHGFNYESDPYGKIDYSGSKTIPFRYFLKRDELNNFKILFT
jgi:hypothetical protein